MAELHDERQAADPSYAAALALEIASLYGSVVLSSAAHTYVTLSAE